MANSRFASVPNISIPRSRWKQPFNHSTSFNHGYLVPIDCFEILPGDTYKIDLASLIWMSNPIRPIFGNITAHVDVFFVPMRLVWDQTKKFFGENESGSGPVSTAAAPKIPTVGLGLNASSVTEMFHVKYDSLSHYLGKPICNPTSGFSSSNVKYVSVLKERGMCLIWNNYYRAQQWQAPAIIQTGGNGHYASSINSFITISGSPVTRYLSSPCFQVNKEFDYFTAATIAPQFGNAVSFLAGVKAPLKVGNDFNALGGYLKFSATSAASGVPSGNILYMGSSGLQPGATGTASGSPLTYTNMYADLGAATEATINNLRYAFAVQKYLERSNFGSRFFEMLEVHYGVTSPDATLQIPQRIGHVDFPINISTVLSTAGAKADASTELGMPGASSCTASKKYLCTHAFTEPGYLYVLISTTHERSYTQGILLEDMKDERYQIYSPEFANLGDQEVKVCEITYDDTANNDDVIGYQEHWAEYRYRPHRVSGLLDPQAPNSLDFWVLTEDFNSQMAAGYMAGFLVEDRDNLSRCLVSGSAGPDYIGDFYLPYIATREMPLFTIPGLIDHFGVR